MQSRHYSGSIDGDIKEYMIKKRAGGAVLPTFKGYEPFKQLWDLDLILPELATVRVFMGMVDHSYVVFDEEHLEGLEIPVHGGPPGIHNTKDVLSKEDYLFWEAGGLNPKAYRP